MAVGSRIIAGLFASTFGRMVLVVGQLVVVPVLIARWTLVGYGEWVAISAIASYVSYSNLGIPGALRAHIAMASGQDDNEPMIEAFQTSLALIAGTATTALCICGVMLWLFPPDKTLHLQWMTPRQGLWVCLWFGVQLGIYAISSVFNATLSALGKYPLATALDSTRQFLEFTSVCVLVGVFKAGPTTVVMLSPLTWLLLTVALAIMVWRYKPEVYSLPPRVRRRIIAELIRPMMGVMGMTLGYVGMSVQVPRILLAMTAGPKATAIYALASMIMRVVRIPIDIPAHSATVEISLAVGKTDFSAARSLISATTRFCLWLALASAPVVICLGPWASSVWTAGRGHVPVGMLLIMTCSTLLFAVALPCQEALMAVGRLDRATRWLFITAIPFVAICWAASKAAGVYGAAASCVLLDLVYAVAALTEVLRFFEVDLSQFLGALTVPPTDIAMRQLRRFIPAKA